MRIHKLYWMTSIVGELAFISMLLHCLIVFRRIAAVASFMGLRHFLQGHNFKQWTGDDLKALMKASDLWFLQPVSKTNVIT
jgi:hypothetical protein